MQNNFNIAILGSTGLLGQALVTEGKNLGYNITGIARKNADINLDITKSMDVINFFNKKKFDVVINTCAYVDHNFCDNNPLEAYNLNSRPSAILSNLAKEKNFKYVFISTDGYFTGDKNLKHDEKSEIFLLNEYARTKYSGEAYSLANKNSLAIRTNIVGFKGDTTRPTFVEGIISSLILKKPLVLFEDYFTSSITVYHFSKALYKLLDKNPCGVLNLASNEVSSKKDFIELLAKKLDLSLENATKGSVSILSSKRAESLGLDVCKAEKILGFKLPCLEETIERLKIEYEFLYK